MVIVLFLLVFAAIAIPHHLYTKYREKVPTPYDLYQEEFSYTHATRPGSTRCVTRQGEEILPYEYLFAWLDARELRRRGATYREAYFIQRGGSIKEIPKTEEFRQRLERYHHEFQEAYNENSGEAEADRNIRLAAPFTFRRISFSPKSAQ